MSSVLQLLASGLATGAIYALIAVGFSLLWQTSQTINFAQGEFVMVPAFFVLVAMNLGLPFPVAALVGIVVAALVLGVLFKHVIVDPMLRHGVLPLVVATIALSLFMREAVKDFYSAQAQPFPSLVADRDITIFGTVFSAQSLTVIAVAVVVVAALHGFLSHTRLGRMMQATAQNPSVARILGIPVERMILYTFLINAVLCAVASILISPIYLAKFTNGETLGLAAFVAAVIGGFNQARGAMLGGVLLGVLDNLCAAYVSAQYRAAVPLLLLVVIILFRPQGILGRAEERTV
ncbi:branched-chain amino acid ABC transporter permease [uncultured Alsobacter sp.]|uniref:branched-chain amino acid ABC transporter permease n=1 Tax=uncultured Alsobacter sp. TaxID=1748258 RepID=UPI0025DE0AED|nr:branched-chain amino acid ABC transporter permease [uncultured Alsobacter sp.]